MKTRMAHAAHLWPVQGTAVGDRASPWTHLVATASLAALVLALVQMSLEWRFGGEGFWGLIVYISASLLRGLQDVASPPGFIPLAVLVGAFLHVGMSIGLTGGFVRVAPRLVRSRTALTLLGVVYGIGVFVVMWWLVLPLVDPVMLRLAPLPYLAAHAAWGAAVGALAGPVADHFHRAAGRRAATHRSA